MTRVRVAPFVCLVSLVIGRLLFAHNLDNKMTYLTFDQETLAMIGTRAQNNQPLLVADDVIGVVLKTTPGEGEPVGVGGYLTFYIPEGTQVMDVFYGVPDGDGNMQRVPMKGQADIALGDGDQANASTPGLAGLTLGPNVLGVSELAVTGSGEHRGTLAGVYADTGIFFSTDPRTVYNSWTDGNRYGLPIILTNNEGDVITPVTMWDGSQLMAYGVRGNREPLLDANGRGNGPWGLASVVPGPESGYAWDFNLDDYVAAGFDPTDTSPSYASSALQASVDQEGPWKRIAYPGSQVASDTAGLQTGWSPIGQVGVDASSLGATLPLPPTIDHTQPNNPNAVRVAFGALEVGRTEWAVVKLRLLDTPKVANDCFEMFADAFGGDAAGTHVGKDHLWRYYDPTLVQVDLCSSWIQKTVSKPVVAIGETFEYEINFINLGPQNLTNVQITDTLPSEVSYVSAVPPPSSTSPLRWDIGNVATGEMVTITLTVEADSSAEFGALNEVCVTNNEGYDACAEERVIIGNHVVLVGDKTVASDCAIPGGTVEYTIQLSNIGSVASAANTPIAESLPAGFTFANLVDVTVNGAPGTVNVNATNPNQPILTVVQGIQPGEEALVTFRANVPAGITPGTYLNSFSYVEDGETFVSGFLAPVTAGLASIGDFVFRDWNGNGIRDLSDQGLPGVTLGLYEVVGATETLIASDTSDAAGAYLFEGLVEGDYVVRVLSSPAGHVLTGDPEGPVDGEAALTLTLVDCSGSIEDADFGFLPGGAGSIGDQVFEDLDGNGLFDGADAGIPGVTLTLFADTNGDGLIGPEDFEIGTQETDPAGQYQFAGLATGVDYLVRVEHNDPDLAAHFSPMIFEDTTGLIHPVSALAGAYTLADFGFSPVVPGSIGDKVFLDRDQDGLFSAGDEDLANVTVTLYVDRNADGILDAGDTVFATTVTDGNGEYLFSSLPPGDYIVDVAEEDTDLPSGLAVSVDELPVSLTEGMNHLDADFPFVLLIDKEVDRATASAGDLLHYTITPTYPGAEPVVDLTVTDGIPVGTSYSPASANAGGSHDGGSPGSISWSLGSTSPGIPGIGAKTTTSQTVYASKATSHYEADNTDGYGACPDLYIEPDSGHRSYAFIEFDLSFLSADCEIDSANLRVKKSGHSGGGVVFSFDVRRVTSAWVEGTDGCYDGTGGGASGLSWANRSAGTPWTSAGGDFAATSYDVASGGNSDAIGTAYEFDVRSLVDEWNTGTANHGLAIVPTSDGPDWDWFAFHSDDATNQDDRPRLDVVYSCGADTTNVITLSRSVVTGSEVVEVTMTLTSDSDLSNVTPPANLTVEQSGSASATKLSGPTPASANLVAGTPLVFVWQYQVSAGAGVGSLVFKGTPTTSTPGSSFGEASSASVISFPPLTFAVTVDAGAGLAYVTNRASFADSSGTISPKLSPPVATEILGSIGDRVWIDANRNGIQDLGEPGLAGVTVNLYDALDQLVASTTTDAGGFYSFEDLSQGDYVVEVLPPAGYSISLANQGSDDGVDSDVNPGDGRVAVNLSGGEVDLSVDAGLFASVSVVGSVFRDVNELGDKASEDTDPISGVTIELYDADDNLLATTTTAVDGSYAFTGLVPGIYTVRELDPSGFVSTTDTDGGSDNRVWNLNVPVGTVGQADFWDTAETTHVLLSHFGGLWVDGKAVVRWETSVEVGTVGFRLLRSATEEGPYRLVSHGLVPALIGRAQGGVYEVVDPDAEAGSSWYYQLRELEAAGGESTLGPFEVVFQTVPGRGPESAGEQPFVQNYRSRANEASPDERQRKADARRSREEAKAFGQQKRRSGKKTDNLSRFKISVSEPGVKAIVLADLEGLLSSDEQKAIRKGRYELLRHGEAVAYHLSADRLLFYAPPFESMYTDSDVFWLQPAAHKGLRMANPDVSKAGEPLPGQTFVCESKVEEDHWNIDHRVLDPGEDYWYWDYLLAGNATQGSKTFSLPAPGATGGAASLMVALHGFTDLAAANEHHAVVAVNGTTVGEVIWEDGVRQELHLELPAGLLIDGDNEVTITALRGSGVPYSVFVLDEFVLRYPRKLEADADTLWFTAEQACSSVSGFSTDTIVALDVSDPHQPRWLDGVEPREGDTGWSVQFASSPGSAYVLAGEAQVQSVALEWAPILPSLRDVTNVAEYLVITPEGMEEGAQAFAEYRAALGLSTKRIPLGQIYDEFNHGLASPFAIRSFLAQALDSWQARPDYVLLAGAGTFDYRDIRQFGDNLIPPLMVGTPFGLCASDTALADVDEDGVPDLSIGRIPALSNEELQSNLAKVIAYESSAAAWKRSFSFVADNPDYAGAFDQDSERMRALVEDSVATDAIYLGALSITDARSALFSSVRQGRGLVNYVGHGGMDRMAAEGLLRRSDLPLLGNADRPTVLVALTCTLGRFAYPGIDSLGEDLVRMNEGGAVAAWSPGNLSFNGNATALGRAFFSSIGAGNQLRMGDATRLAMDAAPEMEHWATYIFNLLGDPALTLLETQEVSAFPSSPMGSRSGATTHEEPEVEEAERGTDPSASAPGLDSDSADGDEAAPPLWVREDQAPGAYLWMPPGRDLSKVAILVDGEEIPVIQLEDGLVWLLSQPAGRLAAVEVEAALRMPEREVNPVHGGPLTVVEEDPSGFTEVEIRNSRERVLAVGFTAIPIVLDLSDTSTPMHLLPFGMQDDEGRTAVYMTPGKGTILLLSRHILQELQ